MLGNHHGTSRVRRFLLSHSVALLVMLMLPRQYAAGDESEEAHWRAGRVRVGERWHTVEQAAELAREDKKLASYVRMRARGDGSLKHQQQLAAWCGRNGLARQAQAHWSQVLLNDPGNSSALKALGLQWYGGRLITNDDAERQRELEKRHRREFADLKSTIRRLRKVVAGDDDGQREEAFAELRSIDDNFVVIAIEQVLLRALKDRERMRQLHGEAIRALAEVGSDDAVRILAWLAVTSRFEVVREAARAELKRLPFPRYVPVLLAGMANPIETTVLSRVNVFSTPGGLRWLNPVTTIHTKRTGPRGQTQHQQRTWRGGWTVIGRLHALGTDSGRIEGPYRPELAEKLESWPGSVAHRTADGEIVGFHLDFPVVHELGDPGRIARARAIGFDDELGAGSGALVAGSATIVNHPEHGFLASQVAWLFAEDGGDIARVQGAKASGKQVGAQLKAQVERQNALIEQVNARIAEVLTQTTQADFGADAQDWWQWWQEHVNEHPHHRGPADDAISQWLLDPPPSGIAPGTNVWTNTGRRAIEDLLVGDLVLSQNVQSGELAYKPIIAMTRQATPTHVMAIEGDELACASGTAFWQQDKHWWLARDITDGAYIRLVRGVAPVTDSDPLLVDETCQLVVADFHTFFIGNKGMLVHDIHTPLLGRRSP